MRVPFCSQRSLAANQKKCEVAVTFDDLPGIRQPENLAHQKYVTKHLLEKIKASKVPAIGFFVNEYRILHYGQIDERVGLLKSWLDAGHALGNHTFSHIAINTSKFEEYNEDLIRGETVTRMLFLGSL